MSGNNSVTSNVLSLLGWDEGLAIPVANSENQGLIQAVDKRQRDIESIRTEDDGLKDKIDALTSHLKNVRQELSHTQGLVTACVREQETESHIMKVGQREEGRLKQEIERLMKSLAEMKQKKNQLENRIYSQASSLEEMKSQMNWDQQALEAWLDESEKKAEDSLALEKYRRQDEGKIRELSLQQERLTDNALQKRRKLEAEVIETQTKRVELDKTAEEFRRMHRERADLITQWENNIDRMQQRDREIDAAASHLAAQKQRVVEKEDVIREKQQFLDNQVDNNREQDKKITLAERLCVRTKLALNDAEQQKDQFREQLEVLKRTCDRTASDLESTRSQVTHLKKEVANMKNRLEQATHTRLELQERLKKVTSSKLTAEEQAAAMDSLMEEEETTQKALENELKRQRDLEFREQQKLHNAKIEEKNIGAAIDGARAAIKNLRSRIAKMDHEVLKQQEILYTQDFNTQQLERRINRMQGETSNEEKMTLEAKIAELTEEHSNRLNTKETLNAQLKHLRDDIRRVKRDMEKIGTERDSLNSKINELNLHNDSSQREFKKIRTAKQDLLVDDNIMKLEIKRLREILYNKADGTLELETRKQQLETSIKERRAEIAIHMDMLRSQKRAADEERQQYSSELHARSSQIDKLQKRYEIVMVAMAPPEGEEEKSQAYYVIKAAQEKEALQRQGDMLDAKIRKAEKEIRALENSLRVVNSANESYRKTCSKVSDSADELREKGQLEEQLRAANDKYKHKRRQIRELSEELETMNETLANLKQDTERFAEEQEQLTSQLASKERERKEHSEKMDRAEKTISRAVRDIRGSSNQPTNDEKDIAIREQREFNRRVANELLRTLKSYTDALVTASGYLNEAGIPIPQSGSESGSSRASSLSSHRSSVASSARSTGRPAAAVNTLSFQAQPSRSPAGSARSSQASSRGSRR